MSKWIKGRDQHIYLNDEEINLCIKNLFKEEIADGWYFQPNFLTESGLNKKIPLRKLKGTKLRKGLKLGEGDLPPIRFTYGDRSWEEIPPYTLFSYANLIEPEALYESLKKILFGKDDENINNMEVTELRSEI